MKNRILVNAIRTPDGTLLHSKHRHDCVIYKDKNGKEYGVDGGYSRNNNFYEELFKEELEYRLAEK